MICEAWREKGVRDSEETGGAEAGDGFAIGVGVLDEEADEAGIGVALRVDEERRAIRRGDEDAADDAGLVTVEAIEAAEPFDIHQEAAGELVVGGRRELVGPVDAGGIHIGGIVERRQRLGEVAGFAGETEGGGREDVGDFHDTDHYWAGGGG